MPTKPKSPCNYPGCPELTLERYCKAHQKKTDRAYDKQRGTAAQRGYDHRWRKARRMYLARHPLCVECEKQGVYVPATEVDHITAHKGDRDLFWDSDNWQGLCKRCHSAKTAKEDGRWG
jgi:5-methylcytosine-specific restriction protein A